MKAGNLSSVVTVQTRSSTVDSVGQQSTTWTDLFTDRADIRPMSGREMFAAQAVQSEVTHQITMRYRPEWGVGKTATSYRILYESRVFDIRAVLEQGMRSREVRIMASEGLTNG
jgi:SPP1 family predicted phage head-tail adaptor